MFRHACVLTATAVLTVLCASCCYSRPTPSASDTSERPGDKAPSSAVADSAPKESVSGSTRATPPTPAPEEGAAGRVAFSRGGNVYVLDLETREEIEITNGGSADWQSATTYGCPTFLAEDTLMFLKWTTDADGLLTDRAALVGVIQSESEPLGEGLLPTGLGWSEALDAAFVVTQTEPPQPDGDNFGAILTLCTLSRDGGEEETSVETWFGGVSIDSARVRCTEDGLLVSVPNFPTDVSDHYTLRILEDGTTVDLVPEEWLGAVVATGIDFAGGEMYATFIAMGDAAPLEPGLYRVDLNEPEPELVARVDETNGLAVSATLGVAVVSTWDGALKLIDLGSGKVRSLGSGVDPDIWPR